MSKLKAKAYLYLIASLLGVISLPCVAQTKIMTEELCKAALQFTDPSQYPKKRQVTTALAPACVADDGKSFYVRQVFVINDNDLGKQFTSQFKGSESVLITQYCKNQLASISLSSGVVIKMEFIRADMKTAVGSLWISEEKCASLAIQKPSQIWTIETCNQVVKSTKSKLPLRVDPVTTRDNLECKPGFSKPAALVIYDSLTLDTDPVVLRDRSHQKETQERRSKTLCSRDGTKEILAGADILWNMRIKGIDLAEVRLTEEICNKFN